MDMQSDAPVVRRTQNPSGAPTGRRARRIEAHALGLTAGLLLAAGSHGCTNGAEVTQVGGGLEAPAAGAASVPETPAAPEAPEVTAVATDPAALPQAAMQPAAAATPLAPAPVAAPQHEPGVPHLNDGLDHCRVGHAADPRDAALSGEPERFEAGGGQVDLIMPKEIRDWMTERGMQKTHDEWHLIRQLDSRCLQSNATPQSCTFARDLETRGLKRFAHQECSRPPEGDSSPGDGAMFMWMHRHMIDSMKQAFPSHPELFTPFAKVPLSRDDPNNPTPGRNISWSAAHVEAIGILDNIEQNVDMFESEEYLAWYIQCRVLWTAQNPNGPSDNATSGVHLAMHAQWSVFGSPSSVGDQSVSIENFVFWKLHGWVDDIWQRYRAAKGLTREDPAYKQGLFDMCKEMHEITLLREGQSASTAPPEEPSAPAVPETGLFALSVRPFLNERCSSCHGGTSPMANLVLGGMTGASSDIINGLVNADATNLEYKLVVPGNPEQSWLYLKATGESATVSCANCVRDPMPPAGDKLTTEQLALLRQWITDGATTQ
jgi:hypothetical protein